MFGFRRNNKKEQFFIDWQGQKVKLTIYHENRKDSRVSLSKSGVRIRLPLLLPEFEKKRLIDKFILWAKERLTEKPYFHYDKYKRYEDGEIINLFDGSLTIKISKTNLKRHSATIKNDVLAIKLGALKDEDQKHQIISKLIYKTIAKRYKPYFWQRLTELNTQHQFGDLQSIRMKNNSTNWASCSNKGNINISVRLLLAPKDVVDYVLIHELAHLQQQNHSAKFWKIVAEACPNYQTQEKWLKENAKYCVI